ncbi:helix-turn-helix transcriptional regulator [Sphingomonas sp. So64.6b]|uniref:helix-turn-helix transcriptional regulator n=1 Tax=Sphingomonas sp. So64.6b TaxID=2997354 RepID=UPI001601451F|nr:helix-turn-helix transcriptional regulator [Sphingomonas sp. So64.6b]QNA83695.1 helix-turn-helix transcriptional regulator [Sphingomonas sp. So64.6b]
MYSQAFAIDPIASGLSPLSRSLMPQDGGPKIIVLDAARNLIQITAGARAMLAKGTVLRRCFDQLATVTRGDAARLDAALKLAVAEGQAHAAFEGDGEPLDADLAAVSTDGTCVGHVVMILKPALEERRQRLCDAQARFGLTRAESRLLAALFEGCSVPQAADRLGVARSTARTHLQRVFDKTGARRQGDLLRLVACA